MILANDLRVRCSVALPVAFGIALCFVAGCGGGGGSSPSPSPTPSVSPSPLPSVSPLPSPSPSPSPTLANTLIASTFQTVSSGNQSFLRITDINGNIVVASASSNLTDPTFPSWTPDASTLYLGGDPAGSTNARIFRLSLLLPTAVQIDTGDTGEADNDGNPVISPDGTILVFNSNRGNGTYYHLYAMTLPTGTVNALTDTTASIHDYSPSFSPDGKFIVYGSGANGTGAILKLAMNGAVASGAPIPLTHDSVNINPMWSVADGSGNTHIVFSRQGPADTQLQIYSMNPDGTNMTNLSAVGDSGATVGSDQSPSWSPDGSEIVFSRLAVAGAAVGVGGIFRMNADGTGQTQIEKNDSDVTLSSPVWSPFTTRAKSVTSPSPTPSATPAASNRTAATVRKN